MLLTIGEAVTLGNDSGNEDGLVVAVFSKCCCVYIEYYTCRGFAVSIKGRLLRCQYSFRCRVENLKACLAHDTLC